MCLKLDLASISPKHRKQGLTFLTERPWGWGATVFLLGHFISRTLLKAVPLLALRFHLGEAVSPADMVAVIVKEEFALNPPMFQNQCVAILLSSVHQQDPKRPLSALAGSSLLIAHGMTACVTDGARSQKPVLKPHTASSVLYHSNREEGVWAVPSGGDCREEWAPRRIENWCRPQQVSM